MKAAYASYLEKLNVDLSGKTFIVTGANSGIGFQTARHLLFLRATVLMACRNLEKARSSAELLRQEFPSARLHVEVYDQSSYSSIRMFAERIRLQYRPDGLICNAGVYYPKKDARTEDGFELTVGTNYIGQFLLIESLREMMDDSFRLVIVTSLTAIQAKMRDLSEAEQISRNRRYAFSKLLSARDSYELNHTYGVQTVLVHPGVCSTNILFNTDTGLPGAFARAGRRFLNCFTHSAEKAALTSLLGAVCDYAPDLYIKPRGPFAISGYPTIRKLPRKFVSDGLHELTRRYIAQKAGIYVSSK